VVPARVGWNSSAEENAGSSPSLSYGFGGRGCIRMKTSRTESKTDFSERGVSRQSGRSDLVQRVLLELLPNRFEARLQNSQLCINRLPLVCVRAQLFQ